MQKTKQADFKCLSGSALKLIAVITMLIDHIAFFLMSGNAAVLPNPLLELFGKHYPLSTLMRFVGRTTFPLYCFLLVEGFVHTQSRKRYGISLFVFALLSDVPWDLLFHGTVFAPASQNVFYTLLLGFLGLCAIEHYHGKPWKELSALALLSLAAFLLRCDYGVRGLWIILVLYILRERKIAGYIAGVCLHASTWKTIPAYVLILLYNGERGFIRSKWLKYAFYAFYPVHLLVIYFLRA